MIIFGGILLIILGLLNTFAGDFIWDLTVLGNKWEGKASERSELWDFGRKIGGYFLILLGVGIIIFGIVEPGITKKRKEEQKQAIEQRQKEDEARRQKLIEEIKEKQEKEKNLKKSTE